MFRSVCQEFCPRGGSVSVHAGIPHPPGGPGTPPPRAEHSGRYGQRARGTHPTGMQSCQTFCIDARQDKSTSITPGIRRGSRGSRFSWERQPQRGARQPIMWPNISRNCWIIKEIAGPDPGFPVGGSAKPRGARALRRHTEQSKYKCRTLFKARTTVIISFII